MPSPRTAVRLAILGLLAVFVVPLATPAHAAAVPVTLTGEVTCEAGAGRWRVDWTITNSGPAPLPVAQVILIPGTLSTVTGVAVGDELPPGTTEATQHVYNYYVPTTTLRFGLRLVVGGTLVAGLTDSVPGGCGTPPTPVAEFASRCDGTIDVAVRLAADAPIPLTVRAGNSTGSSGSVTLQPGGAAQTLVVPATVDGDVQVGVTNSGGLVTFARGRFTLPQTCLPPLLAHYSLFAHANVRYVVANPGGAARADSLVGNGNGFGFYDLGAGVVALRTPDNQRFLTASDGGAGPLTATSKAIFGDAEKFRLILNADDSISLRSVLNGRYVTAERKGAEPLVASRTAIGLWERFGRYDIGRGPVAIQAAINGRYVAAESAGAKPLIANRTAAGPWEFFETHLGGDGSIALRAWANRRWVCADGAGTRPLIANRTAIGLWETFRRIRNDDGSWSFQAVVNGRYVAAESAGARPLVANRTAIGPWERFSVPEWG